VLYTLLATVFIMENYDVKEVFNRYTETEELKEADIKNCGRHDGITSYANDLPIRMMRVYADGSFFVKLGRTAKIGMFQNVDLV
jgi:hypothetical protein